MVENYILTETSQQRDLETILCDFANLYRNKETVKGMQLYRKKGEIEKFLVQFTNRPDFETFSFLINYLIYPMNFEKFKPKVRGYYKTEDVVSFPKLKNGISLMIYDNPLDKQPDNVYITNEFNQTFVFDFGGRVKKIDSSIEDYCANQVDVVDFHHITDIYPAPSQEQTETKPWWKFW